jgi:hypothetical protein
MSFELSEPTNQKPYSIHEDEPVYWGQATDPVKHNPDDFRYLVHAFNPFARGNALILNNLVTQDEGTVTDGAGDQSIDVFKEPERIDERVSLSMSLIDQNHTATWGDVGIIVAAPESSVVLTSPTDAGVLNSYRDRLITQGQSRGILSPDEILKRSSPSIHNEIVALGQSGLKAVGFFYKVNSQRYPINVDLMTAMYQLGGRMGLPVVGISNEKENPYAENKVIRSTSVESGEEEELRIFFDGRCYCVTESSSKPKYRAVDGDTGITSFPSPEKFTAAIDFALRTADLSEDEAEQILEDYNVVDIERRTPTAYFDKDGEIDRVECLQGYGEREVKLNINRHGIANKIQKGAARLRGKGAKSLSQYDTDRMIEAAVKNLSPEKAESIRSWYEQVRPIIVDAWSQQDRARSRMGYRIIR